jgi:hypothetical protein
MAAEALLSNFDYATEAGLAAALVDGNKRTNKFTPTQAAQFAEWEVVDHTSNTGNGLTALDARLHYGHPQAGPMTASTAIEPR